jgi:hypothetical protein
MLTPRNIGRLPKKSNSKLFEGLKKLFLYGYGPTGVILVLLGVFFLGYFIKDWEDATEREELRTAMVDQRTSLAGQYEKQLAEGRAYALQHDTDRAKITEQQTDIIADQTDRIDEQKLMIQALLKTTNGIAVRQIENARAHRGELNAVAKAAAAGAANAVNVIPENDRKQINDAVKKGSK